MSKMDNSNPNTEKSEVNQPILPRKDTQVCILNREELLNPEHMYKKYKVGDDCPYCLEDGNVRVYIRKHKSEKDQPSKLVNNDYNLKVEDEIFKVIPNATKKIVSLMISKRSVKLYLALMSIDKEKIINEIYEDCLKYPSTETKRRLLSSDGITIDGDFFTKGDLHSGSKLIRAFDAVGTPLLLKVLSDEEVLAAKLILGTFGNINSHELSTFSINSDEPRTPTNHTTSSFEFTPLIFDTSKLNSYPHNLMPFSLIEIQDIEIIISPFKKSTKSTTVMLTPIYNNTLAITPTPVNEYIANQIALDIKSVLNELHAKNLFHNDIKPENIFVNSSGHYILGDLGSVASLGTVNVFSTPSFHPCDRSYHEKGGHYTTACVMSDYWMFGCTLYSKLLDRECMAPSSRFIIEKLQSYSDGSIVKALGTFLENLKI